MKYPKNTELIGQKFSQLTIIDIVKNDKTKLLCKCDCGNIKKMSKYSILKGKTKTCGCSKSKRLNITEDYTGKVFGKLTVIKQGKGYKNKNGKMSTTWICKCDCGNVTEVRAVCLKNGHTKTCGCSHKKSLLNKRFGKLTVIGQDKSIKSPCGTTETTWICKCDCGNGKTIRRNDLTKGKTKSCGCMQSSGELKISQILNLFNIPFEQEKIFDDLTFSSGGKARFDFYVDNTYIIEYDGIQHYEYSNSGWNTKEYYEKCIENDKIKNQYCFDNNIPIIRIPYWYYNELTIDDLLLTSKFLLKGDEQHEYYKNK